MKIKSIKIKNFKQFSELTIDNIPKEVKLILLTGPSGTGKTSLLEIFNFRQKPNFDPEYHLKTDSEDIKNSTDLLKNIDIQFHGIDGSLTSEQYQKAFYFRSAYRHEADFTIKNFQNTDTLYEHKKSKRGYLIDSELKVSDNYLALASHIVQYLGIGDSSTVQVGIEKIQKLMKLINDAMQHTFDDLSLLDLGNPAINGGFRFRKNSNSSFHYKNLSGGEKAAFDLLIDLIIKREFFNDAVYCIDELEVHMHSKLQSKLLEVIFDLIPNNCQLWLSTHSANIARKAYELYLRKPEEIAFIDFHDQKFNQPILLNPEKPNRQFWKRIFESTLEDLSELVVPEFVVFCEGESTDEKIYEIIFGLEYPNVQFISLGGVEEIMKGSKRIEKILTTLASGITCWCIRDRDDLNDEEIASCESKGIQVLRKRDIENYLYDEEILQLLCNSYELPEKFSEILEEKQRALSEAQKNGKSVGDIKAISGNLYLKCKEVLQLAQCGSNAREFMRSTLAPLVKPETKIYQELDKIVMSNYRKKGGVIKK